MDDLKVVIGFFGFLGAACGSFVQYFINRSNQKQQWALVALDKRLEVYQECFVMWEKIRSVVYSRPEERTKVLIDAENWWDNNCLYLHDAPRKDFRACMAAASIHKDFVESNRGEEGGAERVKENWADIMRLGETLTKSAGLPPLGEKE